MLITAFDSTCGSAARWMKCCVYVSGRMGVGEGGEGKGSFKLLKLRNQEVASKHFAIGPMSGFSPSGRIEVTEFSSRGNPFQSS